ncbi:uncharacterized protein RHOBADRAFT_53565 [Rhodotorula graminis WP1]|uniref:Autophagy-related protein 17 n=1 Tax=Rhodotorula graminis (strain WP1) TaxID=578459 RepID=A0A194S501_RHOGW|nr:uncharacterized protein RHOBADRAFT_53565 [Rhodotorula graminis WP1]KPV75604.1 hypothetical protein RHOBADRAFT_53565 [Rhodotorula graminis WP1]
MDELPLSFQGLKFDTAGSPAPWTTLPSSQGPLRPRVLVCALVTLARVLHESGEQSHILAAALDRARHAHDDQRSTVARAKLAVLHASRAAQVAHGEARRIEKLSAVFRQGADRAVSAIDRKVLRLVRGGRRVQDALSEAGRRRGDTGGDDPLDPYGFVEELALDLDFDQVDVVEGTKAADDPLGDEWQTIEDDLVATLAGRVIDKASPRLTSTFRMPPLDGAEADAELDALPASLPPTPPASVHSSEPDDPEGDADELDPDEDTIARLLRPIVHPVVALLHHLHDLLGKRLTSSIDAFESLVHASSAAVDTHRLATQRLTKCAAKLRDLRELERRALEEFERTMDELRDVVVELAKWRNGVGDDDDDGDGD